jgi:O-antigen/teichoic acid export membrane protein
MILVARSVNSAEFGAFALAYTIYVLLLGIGRSISTDPLTVRFSACQDRAIAEQAVREAVGVLCWFGALAGLTIAVAAYTVGGLIGESLGFFALVIPGLLIQDGWRLAFFALGRPAQAVLSDSIWTLLQFVFIGVLLITGNRTSGSLIFAWGLAGTLAALFGAYQAHLVPSVRRPKDWLRSNRDLVPSFFVEFFAARGAQQAVLFVVGGVAGLTAVASLRAAEVLLGPLNTLLLSAKVVFLPEGVRLAGRSARALRRGMIGVSGGLCFVALTWGLLLVIIPPEVGEQLLGASWLGAERVLGAMIAVKVTLGLAMGAMLGLRAIAQAGRSALIRVMLGVATLVLGSGGAWRGGAVGAASGMAIVGILSVAVWWSQFVRATREVELGER